MSKLYVNEIFPQSGDKVKISGSLEFQEGESLIILGAEGGAAALTLKGDQGDDATDAVKFSVADGGTLSILGNDGGVAITALTVDMSDAGHAKFNSHVSASGDLYALGSISGSSNLTVGGNVEVTGSLSGSLMYAHAVANAQSWSTMTMPTNYNSVLYGPISIDASQTVTIDVDSNVAIVDIADA